MKQFSKIKHFADKAFIRLDKTEVLSEDLQDAERKIELIKQTCDSTAKKVSACLQSLSKDGPLEKRINKVPEVILGLNMIKHGQQLGGLETGSVLGEVLTDAGEIEAKVGNEMVNYERRVEEHILSPLHKLVEQDLPKIEKLKRTLSKLTSDMDTAKAKLSQANRHSMSASTTGKIDNFKDDFDEIQQKVEQCRDNLAAEMYQLIAREAEISQYIVTFLQYQRDYHQTVFAAVNELLPNVESKLANSYNKPVFGVDLGEHLHATNRTIAYTLELCVCGLMVTGLEEEGLFRIAGSASKVKKLKAAFDAGYMNLKGLINEFSDPHVIGNALKCYLRELPAPLLTFELHQEWMEAVQTANIQQKLLGLRTVVNKLPKTNFDNLRYLIKFLFELSKHQGVNKMTPANIAIVIGPNLLWMPSNPNDPSGENTPMGMNMTMTHFYTSLVDQLVTFADYFFPEEIDFFVTCTRPTEAELNSSGANGILEEPGNNHPHAEPDGLASAKRSQSSSSLEDHNNSPPQGSPKPVLRRKNKPAPVPPTLVKSSTAVSPQNKYINSSEIVKPTQIPNESQTCEVTSKRLSATKRDGWIPPSPNQMNNRRHLGSAGSVSGVNASIVNNDAPPVGTMKVIPPKPPQPQFPQHPPQDSEFKSTFGDGIKLSSQTQNSTLRHKSSFNSGNVPESTQGGNPIYSVNPNQSNSSLQYSHSLPRHFHTENSYKNQRAPRPPSNFYAIPTVPITHSVTSSTVPSAPTSTQNTIDINPKGNNKLLHQFSTTNQPGNIHNSTNESTDGPSAPELLNTVSEQISPPGSRDSGTGNIPGASIGFERVETEVRRLSESNTNNSVSGVQTEKLSDNTNGDESTTSAVNPALPVDSGRPVPAPRSSLLQNVSVGKEKEKEVPAAKGRPTLMAKPRDLAKRSHMNSVGGSSAIPNANIAGGASDPNSTSEGTTSGQAPTVGLTIPIPTDGDDLCDSGLSDGIFGANIRNGGIKDKNVPPQSPRAPYRPPRPQPPPPPKSKAESTDL